MSKHVLPKLGDYDIENLSAFTLQRFTVELTEKGLSANTVNLIISVIKNSLRSAVSFGVAEKQNADLNKQAEDLRKQAAALSEKARNERAQKIQKMAQELETKGTAYTQRLSRVQQAINSQMNDVLRTACENYAKKNGYDMIVDASVVMFYVQANDVTSGLIEEVNKVWKSKGGKFNLSSAK